MDFNEQAINGESREKAIQFTDRQIQELVEQLKLVLQEGSGKVAKIQDTVKQSDPRSKRAQVTNNFMKALTLA